MLTHLFLKITYEICTITIPILWMNVLRHREVTLLAQDHTAGSRALTLGPFAAQLSDGLFVASIACQTQFPTAQWDWPSVNLPKEWMTD